MNDKKNAIIGIVCFVAIWLLCVIAGYKSSHNRNDYYINYIEEVYGNIQFKGEVVQLHKIKRGGRTYGLICIKLNYTNIDSFYRFDNKWMGAENKMSCLKIKNKIAVLPTSFLGNDKRYDKRVNAIFNAKYIEVNINNSRQIVYIDSIGNRFSTNLNFPSNNLIEEDLQICSQ
ncbi:MAG: hypothetical protein LBN27_02565 [Prevotellaceae bacterium]|jgi:hypothetical protein|nr:hypothetical protein [Prevotellaceae bacterium]